MRRSAAVDVSTTIGIPRMKPGDPCMRAGKKTDETGGCTGRSSCHNSHASEAAQHLEPVPHGDFFQHLMRDALCGVLLHMADEKSNKSKNTILWIITVVLIALAIFLYKR